MTMIVEGTYLGDLVKREADDMLSREKVTILAAQVLSLGEVIGKITKSTPTTGTLTGSGNGTMTSVTAGVKALIGSYIATCKALTGGTLASATTGAAGSNTGGGTMTAVTAGAKAEPGTYTITCKDVSVAAPGAAVATAFAGNTGSGAMSAVVVGSTAKIGIYILRVNALEGNKGHFTVTYPDGSFVGEGDVATEFVGGGLTFTLADATDYIIGDGFYITVAPATTGAGATWEIKTPSGVVVAGTPVTGTGFTGAHLNFTINDSGTNFAVGDTFTVLVSNGGTFAVKAPDGTVLPDATVGAAYTNAHLNFTINDGTADFVVGDYFTVAVAAGSGAVKALNLSGVDGSQDAYGIVIQDYAAGTLKTIAFTSGGTYVLRVGDKVHGATSGATAIIQSLSHSSGTWAGGDEAGTLILDQQIGTFESENLNVGDNSNVATIGGNTSTYSANRYGVAITRNALIDPAFLIWPTGASATQKAAALAILKAQGVLSDRPAA